FSGLSPLLPIWKAFRNIAYALLAVIMIVIGFMVMFRKKIDPKTVVTVQNALPKIVLALILVTFSYAIAAFFIDLMYLVMAVIINLLVGASSGKLGADTATKYLNGNIATLFGGLFGGGMKSIDDVMSLLFYSGDITPYLTWTLNFASFGMYALAQGALVAFIIAIVLIIGYIRIIFMLVSAYIQIIIAILVAPFQLMVEAFPGSNSFSSWLKNLIANLSVFPVTAAMILVGTILTKTNTGTMFSNADQLWTPPLLSSGGAKGVAGMIGLGLMLSIPNIAKAIKEALKTKPLVGGGGAGMGAVGGLAMQAFQVGSMAFSHKIQSQQVKATQDQAQAFRDYTGKKSPGGGE
ncbi:MAG: hypothetical protein NTY06_01440, partial [Candidatus Gottesmanbacteria bacterium]|nr:hypothetical protein [Candidatus Gottesmanbacteria bacterium]